MRGTIRSVAVVCLVVFSRAVASPREPNAGGVVKKIVNKIKALSAISSRFPGAVRRSHKRAILTAIHISGRQVVVTERRVSKWAGSDTHFSLILDSALGDFKVAGEGACFKYTIRTFSPILFK